jgi:hypothetical protein
MNPYRYFSGISGNISSIIFYEMKNRPPFPILRALVVPVTLIKLFVA